MLHILNKSPANFNLQAMCENGISKADVLVLIEEAVAFAVLPDAILLLKKSGIEKIYVLESELKARGFTQIDPSVVLVNYPGFVDLTIQHVPNMSW